MYVCIYIYIYIYIYAAAPNFGQKLVLWTFLISQRVEIVTGLVE